MMVVEKKINCSHPSFGRANDDDTDLFFLHRKKKTFTHKTFCVQLEGGQKKNGHERRKKKASSQFPAEGRKEKKRGGKLLVSRPNFSPKKSVKRGKRG